MTSFATLTRGASQSKPYSVHLKAMPEGPTRYSDDIPLSEWRQKKFFSVLDPQPSQGLMAEVLRGKSPQTPEEWSKARQHLVGSKEKPLLAGEAFQCAQSAADWTSKMQPVALTMMPAALPALKDEESRQLTAWLEAGAEGPKQDSSDRMNAPGGGTPEARAVIDQWEGFLNGETLNAQLVARYVYEHSFLARWNFAEIPDEFYEIVRSTTPPGTPIKQIVTDWIQDDPGVRRPFYRLRKISRVLDARQHVLWKIDQRKLSRLKELFSGSDWTVAQLPSYDSINPFETFSQIPVRSRSAFMRENSRMIFQSVARGPICTGHLATYAVDEHFWLWFLNDDADPSVVNPTLGLNSYTPFYQRLRNNADAFQGGENGLIWGDREYFQAFVKELAKVRPNGLTLKDVWSGNEPGAAANPNAWLVLMRSEISTNLTDGTQAGFGGLPTSAWLLSYANFERMYYNGAVQFSYWGSQKHKIESFNHQVVTRTEAEDLFLTLVSKEERAKLRSQWNGSFSERFSGVSFGVLFNPRRLFRDQLFAFPAANGAYSSLRDLGTAQWERSGEGVRGKGDAFNDWPTPRPEGGSKDVGSIEGFEAAMAGISRVKASKAPFPQFLPNVAFVRLGGNTVYTLLTNRGYRRDKLALMEVASRRPQEDELVIFKGILSATPEIFFDVPLAEGGAFVKAISEMKSGEDWAELRKRWGKRREDADFWDLYDWFGKEFYRQDKLEAAILDLNYYDNRN